MRDRHRLPEWATRGERDRGGLRWAIFAALGFWAVVGVSCYFLG